MSESVQVALIVSIAQLLGVWLINHRQVIPKLDHITALTNSTLTAANRRIDELEAEVRALKSNR